MKQNLQTSETCVAANKMMMSNVLFRILPIQQLGVELPQFGGLEPRLALEEDQIL